MHTKIQRNPVSAPSTSQHLWTWEFIHPVLWTIRTRISFGATPQGCFPELALTSSAGEKEIRCVTFQKRTKLLSRTRKPFGMSLPQVPSLSPAERDPSFPQTVNTGSLSHWPRYHCRQKRPTQRGKKSHCHLLVLYKRVKCKRKEEKIMEERPLWGKSYSLSTRIIK